MLEIERRWSVKPIKTWEKLHQLFDNLIDIKRITQVYLKEDADGISPRIRKSVDGLVGEKTVHYTYNKKKLLENGVNQENEFDITEKQYFLLLETKPKHQEIFKKTRFVFNYQNQEFELDVFSAPKKETGKAVLELEMKSKDQKINFPPFLDKIKEITEKK